MDKKSQTKSAKNWFAFYTRPKWERKIDERLKEQGIESYVPLHKIVRKWSDRNKILEEPLFKGYVFAYVNEKERLDVLATHGVIRTITFNGRLAIIPDYQIESIKKSLEHREKMISVGAYFTKGEKVKIVSGVLEGVMGIIQNTPEGRFIVIEIEGIGKSLRVKLSPEEIIKVV